MMVTGYLLLSFFTLLYLLTCLLTFSVRHNAAAGGSHHGYWYNLPNHPGGPSFTTSVCPKNAPLGEFQNNTAHSFGR